MNLRPYPNQICIPTLTYDIVSSVRNFKLVESSLNDIHQGLGRPDFASWYLIYGYVNGSATSCPNGISFSW